METFVGSNEEFSGQGDKTSREKILLTFASRWFSRLIAKWIMCEIYHQTGFSAPSNCGIEI